MWRRWDAEWEYKKSYLVQSLFEDVTILPPIAESTIEPESRAPSPLPDLIIENEKNRHDEPEEYYDELAMRMLKLYRKLFFEEDDSSENTYKLLESVDDHEDNLSEQSVPDMDTSQCNLNEDSSTSDSNISDGVDLNESLYVDREALRPQESLGTVDTVETSDSNLSDAASLNKSFYIDHEDLRPEESHGTVETDSSPSITHEIVITQAIVHREPENYDREDSNNNIIAYQRASSLITNERSIILNRPTKKSDFFPSDKNQESQQGQIGSDSERLVVKQAKINEAATKETPQSEDEYDIEVMRLTPRKIRRLSSISEEKTPSNDTDNLSPITVVERRMSVIEDVESPETRPESDPYISSDESSSTSLSGNTINKSTSPSGNTMNKSTSLSGNTINKSNSLSGNTINKSTSPCGNIINKSTSMSANIVNKLTSLPGNTVHKSTSLSANTENKLTSLPGNTINKSTSPSGNTVNKSTSLSGNTINEAPTSSNTPTKRTNSSSTVTESPKKRTRYEAVSVQTEPIYRKTNWEEVSGNFFYGTPIIYNLCRCRNHKC